MKYTIGILALIFVTAFSATYDPAEEYIKNLTSDAQTQLTGKATKAGEGGGQTLIGGTAATDDLYLQSTSGVGTTNSFIQFRVGNNGATTAMSVLYDGKVGIGTIAPSDKLQIEETLSGSNGVYTRVYGGAGNDIKMGVVRFSGNATNYPGIWLGAATPDVSNFSFLGATGQTFFNVANTGTADMEFRVGNATRFTVGNAGAAVFLAANTAPTMPFEVKSTSGGTTVFSINTSGHIVAGSPVILKAYTVGTLPTGVTGMTAYCTDLLTPTYLGTAVGGGAVVGTVFYNGSAWITN